jgi:NADH/NAD ratio-sensing transcriptional regulator Rex
MVPEGVIVEKVDLAASLAVLSRNLQEKIKSAAGAPL